ncbi:hypothetical protein KKC91_01320 [bacterium]|nr:hypothetical protein [bacterium]
MADSNKCKGNLAVLTVIDSSKKEFRYVEQGFFLAFRHLGIPYRIIDLSKENLTPGEIADCRAVVIAQEGIGEKFSSADGDSIKKSIEESGIGLINFDHRLNSYPSVLRNVLIGTDKNIKFTTSKGLRIKDTHHFITETYEENQKAKFFQNIEMAILPSSFEKDNLISSLENYPVLNLSRLGKGRVIQFFISPRMWHCEYFGHLHGFDGLFYKSIIWTAKKPFLAMTMPPFVTARIDDCSGSGSHYITNGKSAAVNFRYIDVLNKYGYIPNIGLFLDDITDSDGNIIRKKHDNKLAEFSPHAFGESKDRKIKSMIYMKHSGDEYTKEELKKIFKKVDRKFSSWGIRPSKVLNAHYCETGINSIPFLKKREQNFLMGISVLFGKPYNAPPPENWKPYEIRRSDGKYAFIADYMPDYPEFFNLSNTFPYEERIDFLHENTKFEGENKKNDIDEAITKGVEIITIGLDSLFFGCLLTHEQRISAMSIEEWEQVLKGIDKLTSKYKKIFKGYDYIAEYAKSRYDTKITEANYNSTTEQIILKLKGKSALPLKVSVYNDESYQHKFKEIPVFSGEAQIKFEARSTKY